jgi:hypothetical protein
LGLRYFRRISLIPGLRLNPSRGGLSLSVGHRGAWYPVGPHGRRLRTQRVRRRASAYLNWLGIVAADEIDASWPIVERVASARVERGTLFGTELEGLLREDLGERKAA